MILRQAIQAAAEQFAVAGCDTPLLDAEVLLGFVLGHGRAGIVARRAGTPEVAHAEEFAAPRRRGGLREPGSHLVGNP